MIVTVGQAATTASHHFDHRVEHVLTVVDDQQHPPAQAPVDDRLDHRRTRLQTRSERTGDGGDGQIRVSHRRQLHQPDPVDELVDDKPPDLDRRGRLTHAARSGQRDHTGLRQIRDASLQVREVTDRLGLESRQIPRVI